MNKETGYLVSLTYADPKADGAARHLTAQVLAASSVQAVEKARALVRQDHEVAYLEAAGPALPLATIAPGVRETRLLS